TVFTRETVKQEDGTKISVLDALRANSNFKKVYIMLGLNELGWVSLDQFQAQYAKLVDAIQEISPDAIIYLQSILPVSEEKSASSNIYNNDRIQMFNQRIFAVAQEKQVFYINVAEAVADENGCLPSDFTSDGIHLQKKACEQWLAYLKSHTIPQEVIDALPTPSVSPSASVAESPAPAETTPDASPSPSPSAAAETEKPANTENTTKKESASPAPSPSEAASESSAPSPSAKTEP
ncbi:MAG: hypothetical protein IIY71_03675, partial [Oscillospiraceae bacterium]|nr:hypothetical protein [Oscillospiraceae bacterium]